MVVRQDGSMKNVKENEIKLIAKNPRKIKAALTAWAAASDKVNSDPMELDDAPQWVENAWVEVVKVVLPGNRLPTSGEWDMELLGELLGRLQAFGRLYSGEISMGPEVKAEFDRLQKFAASVDGCFLRTLDDLIVVKSDHGQEPVHHVVAKNCVLWNQVAHALSVGRSCARTWTMCCSRTAT